MFGIKTKITNLILALAVVPSVFAATLMVTVPAHAATLPECKPASGLSFPDTNCQQNCSNPTSSDCIKTNPIILWLQFFVNLFTAIVGVGAVVMIIVAGLQYSAARDNPQAIQAAKQKITAVVLGLAAFIFLWAFLQWLIPGGVL